MPQPLQERRVGNYFAITLPKPNILILHDLIVFNMPSDQRMMLPSSQGGLVRYFDEYKSKIQLKPIHVIVLAVTVIAVVLLLHSFFGQS